MMIEDLSVALSFMMVTLLVPYIATAAVMPRRTPAMNALDIHMSMVQMIIIVVGPMMLLANGGKSEFLSWIMMLFTISVALVAGSLVAIKGMQWLTRNRSPLSWAFDVFLDHHAGPGGSTARTLHLMLQGYFRNQKLFYDVDSYQRNGSIGVIMDAAKLSKHICVCLGSETWSRHWCVAAIASANQWRAELSVVNFVEIVVAGQPETTGNKSLPSLHAIASPEADIDAICAILAKKAPRWMLRPYGLSDHLIPVAMKNTFQCKPVDFALDCKASATTAIKNLLDAMKAVPLEPRVSRENPTISDDFLSSDPTQTESAICLSCDHADSEAVNVSRLFSYLLSINMAEAGGTATKVAFDSESSGGRATLDPAAQDAIRKLGVVQDIDLDPMAFAGMVKGGKIPAVIVIMTSGTYKSSPQLLRLGFHQQYSTAGFRPHPIAICDIFSMPDAKVAEDIQQGKVLALGSNYKAAIKSFLTEDVSFARVAMALIQTLESRVFICNCPITKAVNIKECLGRQLTKVALSISVTPKQYPEPEDGKCGQDLMDWVGSIPTQQHRYMAQYIAEEGKAPRQDLREEYEDMLV
jgi:hypothetical protein